MIPSIVPMMQKHLDEMAEIEQQCFSMPWSRQSLADELVNEYACYFVAEDERGSVAGYAGMHLIVDEAYITNVAVRDDCRRMGLATALLTRLEHIAKESGVRRITLEVRESNDGARKCYESLGFSPIAVRKGYYIAPNEDAVIYEKTI